MREDSRKMPANVGTRESPCANQPKMEGTKMLRCVSESVKTDMGKMAAKCDTALVRSILGLIPRERVIEGINLKNERTDAPTQPSRCREGRMGLPSPPAAGTGGRRPEQSS